MKHHVQLSVYFLLFIFITAGCKKDRKHEEPAGNTNFVSAAISASLSSTQIKGLASQAGYGAFSPYLNYDVDFYRVIYTTHYQESRIEVSGLLGIPKGTPSAPSIMSAQHGTMFLDAAAPSNFPAPQAFSGFELLASVGYITLIPDFIGYGVSKNLPHPYYDMEYSGSVVADMIKAVRYYLDKEKISSGNRLFLMGYSEGGYVSLAAQKKIEAEPIGGLSLTAVVAGAGGYDLNWMLTTIATVPTYSEPSFIAMILNGYNSTYGWNRPFSDFFNAPYAGKIPALLDGSKDGNAINQELTDSPSELLNSNFYAALLNDDAEKVLKQAINANSFPAWFPKTPTRLYHGTADLAVPYETSVSAYNKFTALGAKSVELKPIQGGTHATSIFPMMQDALVWLLTADK